MKYVFIEIELRQGSHEFVSSSVHKIKDDRDVDEFAHTYAFNFYTNYDEEIEEIEANEEENISNLNAIIGAKERAVQYYKNYGMYSYLDGEILGELTKVEQITASQYKTLNQFL